MRVGSGSITMYGGEISGNTSLQHGGGIYSNKSGTTINIYGGTIKDNETKTDGGGVYIANTQFTLSGDAIITGNKAPNGNGGGVCYYGNYFGDSMTVSDTVKIEENSAVNGGGIYVYNKTLNLKGGTIGGSTTMEANEATNNGGGVYTKGTFNMSGNAQITGNNASTGGGVYYTASNSLFVSGNVNIMGNKDTSGADSNVNVPTNSAAIPPTTPFYIGQGGLSESAKIGVRVNDGVITTGKHSSVACFAPYAGETSAYHEGNFISDNGGAYGFKMEERDTEHTGITSTHVVNLYNGLHEHAICGKTCGHTGNEKHTDNLTWTGVSSLSEITKAGNYYLTKDVETSGTWEPTDGVNLCLNGHSIKCTNTKEYYPVISIKEGITFTMTDCEGGETSHTFKKDDTGR